MSFDSYREKGYCLARQILSTQWVTQMKIFLETEIPHCLAKVQEAVPITDLAHWGPQLLEWMGQNDLQGLTGETRNILSGHFRLETRLNPLVTTICKELALVRAVRQLLGEGCLCLHMPPVARFILPNNPFACVPVHQDIQYNAFLGHFLTAWVPLVPIDEVCGGVNVYEGRPDRELNPSDQTNPFWLAQTPPETRPVRSFQMQPGDVLFLDPFILHSSAPNLAPNARLSLDYRFFIRRERPQKHFLEVDTMKVFAPHQEAG